jgi:hypothetical protein
LIENNIDRDRLNVIDVQEKIGNEPLTKENMIRVIRNLKVSSDDTIFFFYTGHGAYDKDKDQFFDLQSGKIVLRSDVLMAMKDQRPRLSILVSDCCYGEKNLEKKSTKSQPIAIRGAIVKGIKPLLEKLFFESKGVVDITSSEKGTYSFIYPDGFRNENGVNKGSIFTWNLCKQLDTEMLASKNWEELFKLVQEETNKDFKQVFAKEIRAGEKFPFDKQKELVPISFNDLPQ